ncbi:MAG: malic enzyme-like NAD(P)-binding protein [bacterium]|nr:malic enzyme-like NAD(P)-binding protein [bacterium]
MVEHISPAVRAAHERGKIQVIPMRPLENMEDLACIYTPGVAEVSRAIAADPSLARRYTIAGHTVAVISDGTAVLGLGNIGAAAALPVMEGKCAIFKRFAGLDAIPLVLNTQDPDTIIRVVRAIAPGFAAINLEDIAAPHCFAVEAALQDLGIPVMHDDQHGTAIVVLAALTNACRVTERKLENLRVVISGAGAAGIAVAKLLTPLVGDVALLDSKGALCDARGDLEGAKRTVLGKLRTKNRCGSLADVICGADAFVGVSQPGVLTPDMVRSMAADPIVLALANPTPEIMPDAAHAAGAAVVATGRSDFPNQVNNALAYPGVFRGAIEARAPQITDAMKYAAAAAIAALVPSPTPHCIVPAIFDDRVVPAVAHAVHSAYQHAKKVAVATI